MAEQAGDVVAGAYMARVEQRILALGEFPNRGTPRDHLQPGLRTLSFERRLVIAYRVDGDVVRVLRAVRDLGAPGFG